MKQYITLLIKDLRSMFNLIVNYSEHLDLMWY